MRTTVKLDQDVLEVAKSLSATRGITLGAAISLLARRGIAMNGSVEEDHSAGEGPFPTFSVGESAPSFGTSDVKQALDEE